MSAQPAGGVSGAIARDHAERGGRWRDAFPFGVALLAFLLLIRQTLATWWYAYTRPDSYYSYAMLVPLMIGFMLWTHRKRWQSLPIRRCYPALIVLAIASFFQVYASQRQMQAIASLTLLLMAWSSTWFVAGPAFVRSETAPLLFLLLMAPLPGPLLNDSTHGLQQLSTAGASWLLGHIGFDNVRSGYEIEMQNYTLFVDVPCSGFRTLLALIAFDSFFAYLLDGPVRKRLALLIAALPLAVAINVLRISLIGMVGESISDQAARLFHDYSGLLTAALGFAFLFGLARLFGCRKFAGLAIF